VPRLAWHPSPLPRALAGSAALAVVMGVGRFAYTALLPSVEAAQGFDDAAGGLIASVNLVGYLLGVLWARHTPPGAPRRWLLRSGLVLSVVTTGGLAGLSGFPAWAAFRFAGGVASGLVFVLVASAVLEALPPGRALAGVHYGGVGLGTALSGAVTVLMLPLGWQAPWLVLAAISVALAVPALLMEPSEPVARAVGNLASASGGPGADVGFNRLAVAYFLQGFGYIVSGTFVVRAVQHSPGLEAWAPWVWVATGLAAAPSAVLWGVLAGRLGPRRALVLAHLCQAVGMALPAVFGTAWAALLGAVLFGGTFMGIVTMALELGRRLVPEAAVRAIGSLSAIYAVGQAIAPSLAGWLSQAVADPRPSVLVAAGAVACGGLLLAVPAARSPG
jgi:MFS family permease